MNIFFLRMDKDVIKDKDLSYKSPYIHSLHGSCGALESNNELKEEVKSIIFPELKLPERELLKHIYRIKQELIEKGDLDESEPGKKRCDLAIKYWLHTMRIGDAVFVRNKANQLYLCKIINNNLDEDFFDENFCFKREVEIIALLEETSTPTEILSRTFGRKTIERNACEKVGSVFLQHFGHKFEKS
ncbi:hypothetical protein [Pseudoalteromonas piscicida]|uniref:hypothetical protein n=1 Tax=Pseudoalteromonas piscicida TaxID=43662 RepID=UPI0027E47667|nr:hypothetical protein [Pseudoalteromonas piscicida]WMO14387.1 hypothetical protein NI376_01705 [Pseudoalteromonas piscicida]